MNEYKVITYLLHQDLEAILNKEFESGWEYYGVIQCSSTASKLIFTHRHYMETPEPEWDWSKVFVDAENVPA